jgi:hypothetical protein
MKEQDRKPEPREELDESLTELMKAHLDTVAGGLAGHNSWRQTV